jgi:hypothetical protein
MKETKMKETKMYFDKFKSKKAFLRHRFQAGTIRKLAFNAMGDWSRESLVLRHPQCPLEFVELYATSPRWYVRIVAMLSQPHWSRFIKRALKDPKSTVRFCAYRRALFEEYKDINVLVEMIKADNGLRGYQGYLLNTLRKQGVDVDAALETSDEL